MTDRNFEDRVQFSGLTVTATSGRILDLFERAPHKTFFHIRDTFGAIFGSHRREWLKRTEVQFQRGGMKAAAFGSRAGSEGGSFQSDKKFFYIVDPKKRSVPKSATPRLEDIQAQAFTHSEAALGLETGGVFRARGNPFMAIPIGYALRTSIVGNVVGHKPKAGFSSPQALKDHPRLKYKDTISRKRPGRAPIIYLRKKLKTKTKYLPIFMLVRSINRKPRMKFMSTWEQLESDRARRLSQALTKIVEELERGKR